MVTPAALVILALWILGALYSDIGPYIHVLPVVAGLMLLFGVAKNRRADSNLKR